ncbi:MAG: PilZ domain-containing protein [Desulfovibrio sp.]|nr:PilZ domain-containing protein [Desulfovibrio sp.]
MQGDSYFLIMAGLIVGLLILVVFLRNNLKKAQREKRRQAVINETLVTAQEQNELFELKFLNTGENAPGMPATMLHVLGDSLHMEILHTLPKWKNAYVDVYFHVLQPAGSIFYKFRSQLRSLSHEGNKTFVVLAAPQHLEVGQRRSFMRVKPPYASVRALGVWTLDEADIPRTTRDVGRPTVFYKTGMEVRSVLIENISATGMALRFMMPDPENPPLQVEKGTPLLCLLVYAMQEGEGEKLVTFWCTCQVVNIRTTKDSPPALVLGLEFTNWAMLEPGKTEIHWFHASPTRGVAPLTLWVMQLDRGVHR